MRCGCSADAGQLSCSITSRKAPSVSAILDVTIRLFRIGSCLWNCASSDVGHIQTDTSDIKADLRRTNEKLDVLRDKVDQVGGDLNKRTDAVRADLAGKIDGLSERTDNVRKEMTAKMDSVHADLTGKIDGLSERTDKKIDELGGRIDAVRGDLFIVKESIASLKVWALGLYVALAASLLLVMARGFKWL
jgi:predicted  nucleic acid-binding Zn-ribbon protein